MSYVEKNLMPDEEVVYKAKIHNFIYLPAGGFFFLMIFALAAYINIIPSKYHHQQTILYLAGGLGVVAIFSFLRSWVIKKTTELAVTSKRVIAKFGLLSRDTTELNHSKIESYQVDQSIVGRIFGYGTLIINGTGNGRTPVANICQPLEFRRQAMGVADSREVQGLDQKESVEE